jgi:hypothetical protein
MTRQFTFDQKQAIDKMLNWIVDLKNTGYKCIKDPTSGHELSIEAMRSSLLLYNAIDDYTDDDAKILNKVRMLYKAYYPLKGFITTYTNIY